MSIVRRSYPPIDIRTALSRLKYGFESRRGHQVLRLCRKRTALFERCFGSGGFVPLIAPG